MSESTLSFAGSEFFRKQLLVRNLEPYNVPGAFTPSQPAVNYETNLTVSNVIDSDDTSVSTNVFAEKLYPLNEYGPEGGFGDPINVNSIASTNNPEGTNQGPYYPVTDDSNLELINEFFIDDAYITNVWGPSGGYKDLVIVTDVQNAGIYQPYFLDTDWYYNLSNYTTFDIVFQTDPLGSNGLLSSDSPLMNIAAKQLKGLFEERIASEIIQSTVGLINLDTITDPFSASMLATGQQPFFTKNWKITVPEGPLLAAVSLANRLTGTYFPVSLIPGDYFDDTTGEKLPQNIAALSTINSATGGLLGPILNKTRNPSEIFVANTGNGQKSVLFASLDYNKYKPTYNTGIFPSLAQAVANLFNQDNKSSGGYYVGSRESEPSQIDSPPNEVPVNEFGQQQQTIVYGPQELAQLYEGNIGKLQFGLAGKSYSNDGGIAGQFVWTSPKYRQNAGWRVGKGGDPKSIDPQFNAVSADYNKYQSTDFDFKVGSILDKTQRLVESADNVQGGQRLKHVGNAINQVSKVFNDGYKEITKGSQVMTYTEPATGQQAGIEYCRIFTKDTPYLTYGDLQKRDGIVDSGRRFDYSILNNTYNLNIAPIRNPGSTNIINGKVKKYMFSIENLAWRTSDRPGYTYDDLPTCEKGPNGGRVMWFPPYDLKFNDDSRPSFNETSFLGRPEPIYTYKNTARSGQLSWTILVDNPAMMNTIIEKQLKGVAKERIDSIVDSFFAGCTKYDIYELGLKFNQIPTKDLYIYQQVINNPRLTTEEYQQVLTSIGSNPSGQNTEGNSFNTDGITNETGGSGTNIKQNEDPLINDLKNYENYGFYFHNDLPDPNTRLVKATQPFNFWYDKYIALKNTDYETKAPSEVYTDNLGPNGAFQKGGIPNFFTEIVEGNFQKISTELLEKIREVLVKKNGSIEIELVGSASAPNTPEYNVNLSERRIDSVIQWFDKQDAGNGQTLGQFRQGDNAKLKFITDGNAEGEDISIPKGSETLNNAEVDCRIDIKQKSGSSYVVTKNAQIYSIPAMACRRVSLKQIKVTLPPPVIIEDEETTKKQDQDSNSSTQVDKPYTGYTRTIKPQANVNIEQKLKDGISKKILRHLFTECDYFEVIKESNPMVYDSIKEKIKYFNPAFHSMTPEGLNARLTFLQQCMRPGQTIPVIGPDGRPKYNDALNTAFGAPPILVLRVGDFYNTKIIPTSLSVQYDPLLYDLNPEGIGVQPMIAKISMGFNIIGGMGLKEPVQELQNALSFNFYANTEIYDERATSTDKESVKKLDKLVASKFAATQPTVKPPLNVQQPKKGQSTIGVLGEGNNIDYQNLFDELDANLQSYIESYFNYMSGIQQQNNMGIVQLVNKSVNYDKGNLANLTTPKETFIYGKPSNPEKLISDLVNQVSKDVKKREDPIMKPLNDGPPEFKNKVLREVEEKLRTEVEKRTSEISNAVTQQINTFVTNQQNLDYTFRKMDVVCNKLDGYLLQTNNPTVYDLSGDTFFAAVTNNQSINYLYLSDTAPSAQISSCYTTLKEFDTWAKSNLNRPETYDDKNNTLNWDKTSPSDVSGNFTTPEECRFYLAMSPIITDPTKKDSLITALTNGPEVKEEPSIIPVIRVIVNNLETTFNNFYNSEKKYFDDLKVSNVYKTITTYVLPKIPSAVSSVTPPTSNVESKTKIIKDLYASQNLNTDSTFNGKVTFN
jgi:hypothetical protein